VFFPILLLDLLFQFFPRILGLLHLGFQLFFEGLFLIFRKYNWRGLVTSIGTAIITVFVVILPLEWTDNNPVTFLSGIYFGAYSTYERTSLNAFNIWGFGGMWKPDTPIFLFLNLYTIGWMMFGALVVFSLYFVYKRLGVSEELIIFFSAFLLFFGFFMLPTRIHERYLFPALSVMALLVPFVKKMRPVYAILSGTYLINQAYVLAFLNTNSYIPSGDLVVLIICLIAVHQALSLLLEGRRGVYFVHRWLSKGLQCLNLAYGTLCQLELQGMVDILKFLNRSLIG